MNIKKIILIFGGLLILFMPNYSFAQTQDTTFLFPFEQNMPQFNNNVGFTASLFSGVGFHYKRNITPEHSVKLVFLGWYSSSENEEVFNSYNNTSTWVSFGAEYQYHFFQKKKVDIYALLGARTWYTKDKGQTNTEITRTNSVGIGLGSEYRLGRHFVLNIEGGFVVRGNSEHSSGYNNKNNKETFFGLSGGAGLGFIF